MSILSFLEKFKLFLIWLWSVRAFWLRALICWAIGLVFLWNNYNSNFDYRFRARGNIQKNHDTVLITLNESDWRKLRNVQIDTFESLRTLYINETLTDNFYWDENLWTHILKKVLDYNPKKIGMTFFFGHNLGSITVNPQNLKVFRNPKILWPARISQEGQILFPLFARQKETGIINILPETDGMVRSFDVSYSEIPHFAYTLSDQKKELESYKKHYYINFLTTPNKLPSYSLLDILKGNVPAEKLSGKTILIGAKDSSGHLYPTPLGYMTKSEILAQIVENFNRDQFPQKIPISFYAFYLLILLVITLVIIFEYPQNYSIILIISIGAIFSGLSAWIFDRYYLWTPILAGIIQMVSTYIIFIGYKLAKNERKTWHLEQERRYLFELEQLKNNFINLISHDLKTPIAKIQGIAGRILQDSIAHPELQEDLNTIKNSSQDLYRYIQSILQITRVESSDFKINKTASDINQIIENVVSQLNPLAHNKEITIKTNLEPMFSIEIDSALIHEVIANLLENGIKYSPSQSQITILSKEVEKEVVVSVHDNGPGIPPEEINQVWEKFYRGTSQTLKTQGTGLGLFLVKYFIELHGGKVFLESELDKGTTVGFRIPVQD